MRRAALGAIAVTAACGTPVPQLRLGLAGTASQICPSTDCMAVQMLCDAVMSIRMVDPSEPSKTYFSQCVRVQPDRKSDMCSLRSVDLDQSPVPVRNLDVQIAVYSLSQVAFDPRTNDPICPDAIAFSTATGYPVEQPSAPALGGHTYYHPGDDTVDITLGCTNLPAINAACVSETPRSVAATVVDFDTRLPVTVGPLGIADHLWVSVGEPHMLDGGYVLNPRDAFPLRLDNEQVARWSAPLSPAFSKYVCVDVVEDEAEATPTLRCLPTPAGQLPELPGMRLSRGTLQNVLKSLSLSEFPDEGITIGMVVDTLARGVSDYVVTPSAGTVTYLSATQGPGGTKTDASGIFVSRDAPFGTKFAASGLNQTVPGVGGLVAGKVTIVIVPFVGATAL
ncbi:MAG: hypothetical protein E6J91_24380 [Deltaproteobacteria bacterium]|nr:MAG: hypothetical protein E6J91_24380 [Deltaproteobacteria bacterium]